MDAAGLYSLFSSHEVKEKPLKITSKQAVTEQKDAMFGSYFNLPKVFQRSASYGQDFQHYMIFLPGLQTVRLMGEIEKSPPCQTSIELQEPQEQVPSVVEKQSKRKVESQGKEERMKLLRKEQDDTMKEKKFTVRQEMKQLKGQWVKGQKTHSNQVLLKKINKLKEKRDELQQKVFLLNNKKKELGKEISYLNRRVGVNNKEDEEEQPAVKKKLISYSNYKCMEKTENLKIDEELLNGNLCMSGTDNGIVTTTETCKLALEKFKYHLKLYNRYDALENEGK
ncbi:hypothetical protein EDC94DRAFT_620165 [Helicostylum pulchrum]|nr:hypothetical protein EDC94DRAFT_620165 [Helicostylum pulchrum]